MKKTKTPQKRKRFIRASIPLSILINNYSYAMPRTLIFEQDPIDSKTFTYCQPENKDLEILFKESDTNDGMYYVSMVKIKNEVYSSHKETNLIEAKITNFDLKNNTKTGYFTNVSKFDYILKSSKSDKQLVVSLLKSGD